MSTINIAIAGIGSFTKALVEGVSYYKDHPNATTGLLHPIVGDYSIGDIHFVAAFDIDERKVGKLLTEAIYAGENSTKKIWDAHNCTVYVNRGPTLDGITEHMRDTFIQESTTDVSDMIQVLKESEADILINLIPSGSDGATYAYAEAALEAGCHFINCIPTPLVTNTKWQKRFANKGLLLIGDDIKSQLGATMLNRSLITLLKMRGVHITQSIQKNSGGNADHFNLIYRAGTKEASKKNALSQFMDSTDAEPEVTFHYTKDRSGEKIVNISIEGRIFGNTPISIEATITDQISINGAGSLVDVIRYTKVLAQYKNTTEALHAICAFFMKSPPIPMVDNEAFQLIEKIK